MKKILTLFLVLCLVASLAACAKAPAQTPAASGQSTAQSGSTQSGESQPAEGQNTESQPAENTDAQAPASAGSGKAVDGTLTLGKAQLVVTVNGKDVAMPYKMSELIAAGIEVDEDTQAIELGSGDFFSANLYLDENEDYLLIPAYYNGGDASVSITEAEAEEITMTTYEYENPVDQGVSILGVPFGMAKSDVIALLGEPMSDDGDYLEWHIEVPEIAYEGTLSMYLTTDADDAGVSQVDLTVFEK